MKLLSKALIIGSLSLLALTQAQAGSRHEGNHAADNPRSAAQSRQIAWYSHHDSRPSRWERRSHHHRHGHIDHRPWKYRDNDRYRTTRHYWKHDYWPGYRYDYGRSSGAIIFRW